jgi:raffinose/stachyose/melibiose transport system permease protein
LFRNVLFVPNIIALSVSGVVWTLIYNPQMGLLNSLLKAVGLSALKRTWLGDPGITIFAISFASSWQAYGYYMTLFLAGLQNIDTDLYEASNLDGANKFKQFLYITIPGLRNVFSFVFSMGIINGLKGFSTVWVMTQGGPGSSSFLLTLYGYVKAFRENNFGQSMVSGITLGVMIIFLTRLFNYFRDRYQE